MADLKMKLRSYKPLLFVYKLYANSRRSLRDKFTRRIILSYPKSGRTWVRFFLGVYIATYFKTDVKLDYDHVFQN